MNSINSNYKEVTKNSYGITAEEYSANVAGLAPIASIHHFISLLPPNASIIDIGCGSGRDAKVFSDNGYNVTGIDFCPEMINIATRNASQATFQLMDIETLNFPHSSFGGAWAACSLGHIPKDKILAVLKSIHRILVDHGYLYLALKQGQGEGLEQDKRYAGNPQKFWAYYTEGEVLKLLDNAGFHVLDLKLIDKVDPYQTHAAFRVFCKK